MKNLLLASLASTVLLAFIGCADDSHPMTTAGSTTLTSDSKNMTGSTVTTSTDTTTNAAPPAPDYPAIHSSGQH